MKTAERNKGCLGGARCGPLTRRSDAHQPSATVTAMLLVLAGLSALSVGAPGEDLKDTFYDSVVAKSVLPPPVTSHRNRKIWVGVLINDEIDLLKVAANLYVGHVSGIDVVQAPITISGRPKPLHVHPEPSMRDAVLRIEKLHVHTLGSTSNVTRSGFATEDFRVETQMRRRLGAELVARASPDDCVVTPDLDELLHPEALHAACARLTDDQAAAECPVRGAGATPDVAGRSQRAGPSAGCRRTTRSPLTPAAVRPPKT